MKYRYLIVTEDYEVFGTNNPEVAGIAWDQDHQVYDLNTGSAIREGIEDIKEYTIPVEEPLDEADRDNSLD